MNVISHQIKSGNLTASISISDHLPQFLIVPEILGNNSSLTKSNDFETDWTSYNKENFILDYFSTKLTDIRKIEQGNVIFFRILPKSNQF